MGGYLNVGFTLGLMHRDVRLECALARVAETPLFFGGLAPELYQLCISENGVCAGGDSRTAGVALGRNLGGSKVTDTLAARAERASEAAGQRG
jgi:3-hydroxyisobutyrate dehydrogenase